MNESPTSATPPIKEDPETLELRASPRRVVRLNRRLLIGGVAVLVASMLGVTFWTLRHQPAVTVSAEEPKNIDHVAKAEGLEKLPKDYGEMPKVPKLGAPIGEFGRPLLHAEQNAGLEVLPETVNFAPNHVDDVERAAHLTEQQESSEAVKSKVFFSLRQSLTNAPATASESSSAPAGNGPSSTTNPSGPESRGDQARKESFLNTPADRRIYASGTLESPRSPYEVMAGTVISAALITGINSDLPGQLIGSVTENVFDTVTGNQLLIPQGARLIGRYDSQVAFGQRRVQMIWTRLLMPNGTSILLDQLPGTDDEGQSGLEDQVNWHWSRLFAGAAMSTLVGVAADLAAPDRLQDGQIVIATRESLQQSVNDVGQQITRKNLDVQPTLTIRPGFSVKVIVNKDLILSPYRSTIHPEGPA